MPVNLHTHIRYRCIDRCLSDRTRGWTTEALLNACARDLEELAGIRKRPARSTLHLDIKNMRSGILGQEAPIVFERSTQTFRYAIKGFSLFRDPLNASEQIALQHTLHLLRIFHELDTVKHWRIW